LDSIVGISTSYELDGLGFKSWQRYQILSSAKHPNRHWGPHNPIFNEYKYPSHGVCGWGKMTTHLHLALRSRMSGAIPLLPSYASMEWEGITSPF
jgi:hypothetical protein